MAEGDVLLGGDPCRYRRAPDLLCRQQAADGVARSRPCRRARSPRRVRGALRPRSRTQCRLSTCRAAGDRQVLRSQQRQRRSRRHDARRLPAARLALVADRYRRRRRKWLSRPPSRTFLLDPRISPVPRCSELLADHGPLVGPHFDLLPDRRRSGVAQLDRVPPRRQGQLFHRRAVAARDAIDPHFRPWLHREHHGAGRRRCGACLAFGSRSRARSSRAAVGRSSGT